MPKHRSGLLCLFLAVAAAAQGSDEPTLVDHAIAGGRGASYLDGNSWTATNVKLGMSIEARVPGDIITDLQRAGKVSDPYWNVSWQDPAFIAAWNIGVWSYERSFFTPTDAIGAKLNTLLVFDGVRMGAMISLNGKFIGNASDQFQRYIFEISADDLSDASEFNNLTVKFGGELDIQCGGRYTYSNQIDWAPVMLTNDTSLPSRSTFGFGIWKSVYLVPLALGEAAVTQLAPQIFYAGGHPVTFLGDDVHEGFNISVQLELYSRGDSYGNLSVLGNWPLSNAIVENIALRNGLNIASLFIPAHQTKGAKLWQPHGYGTQHRYNVIATFTPGAHGAKAATTTRKIGFRHIALVTVNDTDPSVVTAAAKGDGTGQFTMFFRVNGAPVYTRGANKIPMDLLDGRLSAVAHRRMIQSAVDANFNMLRIWGGGIWEPRAFFDAADEFGILLYTDMQFTWTSATGSTQERSEIDYQLKRLSHHPSIALWDACNECKGDGLYQSFVMPIVADTDKSRPIWPASPGKGWLSGVSSLTSLPNNGTLVMGSGKASGNRPSGMPFNLESHGPYTAFMKMNMDGVVMPASTPINDHTVHDVYNEFNYPSAVPARTGPGHEGWYKSEFGCVSWSSFESVSSTLPSDQWGVSSTAGRHRNWNASNVILSYFGEEASLGMKDVGESAFKRQLYQSMIGQALFLKTEIEAWRSQNVWGTHFWMYNEIWPTSGWASIEYGPAGVPGQLEGGRWKPLHYILKSSTFADQLSTCNVDGACFVTNDSPFAFKGSVSIRLLNMLSGKSIIVYQNDSLFIGSGPKVVQWFCADQNLQGSKQNLRLGKNSVEDDQKERGESPPAPLSCSTWSDTRAWEEVQCDGNGTNCVLLIEVANAVGSRASHNVLPFVPPKAMKVPHAVVVAKIGQVIDNQVSIVLTTDATAMYVVLTTRAEGRFSDNAFVLEAGRPHVMFFISWGSLDADSLMLLKTSLRIEHLADNLGRGTQGSALQGIWI